MEFYFTTNWDNGNVLSLMVLTTRSCLVWCPYQPGQIYPIPDSLYSINSLRVCDDNQAGVRDNCYELIVKVIWFI